jgi:hypothetical protein
VALKVSQHGRLLPSVFRAMRGESWPSRCGPRIPWLSRLRLTLSLVLGCNGIWVGYLPRASKPFKHTGRHEPEIVSLLGSMAGRRRCMSKPRGQKAPRRLSVFRAVLNSRPPAMRCARLVGYLPTGDV